MSAARARAAALIEALDPAAPSTFRPWIAHTAACYAEGCCPLCGAGMEPPAAETIAAAAEAGMLAPAGICRACFHLFIGPDPRDPDDLTGTDLARIAAQWRLALISTEPAGGNCDP